MTAFAFGVVTIMQTDNLFQRRGVRTSLVANIKETLLTIVFSFIMMVIFVIHIAVLILLSTIAIFLWSWTKESPLPHHYLFLLPFLPTILAIMVQFLLYQRFIPPTSAAEQCYSLLSLLIPVRVHLIKNTKRAFYYHLLTTVNICTSGLLSWGLEILAVSQLATHEDEDQGLLIFFYEVVVPLAVWLVAQELVASLLLWYLVIAPNLSTPHLCPDYQTMEARLTTFPRYWSSHFCQLVLNNRLKARGEEEEEEMLSISKREWQFLDSVVQTRESECPSKVENDLVLRKTTVEELMKMEDLTPLMTFGVLEETENATTMRRQVLMNIRRLRLVLHIRDTFSPSKLAMEGFFYSHPRMTDLHVTCYSCGAVLGICAFITDLTFLHLPHCQRSTSYSSSCSWVLLPLRLIPLALVHTIIMASVITTFILTWETVAHATISFLLLHASFSIGIVITIGHTGPQLSNICIGAINYFIPIFVPKAGKKLMLFQLITLSTVTHLLVILVTSNYQRKGSMAISTTHWVTFSPTLILVPLTVLLKCFFNVCKTGRRIYWLVGH